MRHVQLNSFNMLIKSKLNKYIATFYQRRIKDSFIYKFAKRQWEGYEFKNGITSRRAKEENSGFSVMKYTLPTGTLEIAFCTKFKTITIKPSFQKLVIFICLEYYSRVRMVNVADEIRSQVECVFTQVKLVILIFNNVG